jgi:hypothetical protein
MGVEIETLAKQYDVSEFFPKQLELMFFFPQTV